jgi:hypothetical protein
MSTINHLNEAMLNADKNDPDPKGKIYSRSALRKYKKFMIQKRFCLDVE